MYPQFGDDEAKQKNVLMVLAQLKARDATNADEFLNKRGTFTVLEAGGTAHDVDYISPDMNVVSLMVNDNSNGGRGSPTSVAVSSRYEPAKTFQMIASNLYPVLSFSLYRDPLNPTDPFFSELLRFFLR